MGKIYVSIALLVILAVLPMQIGCSTEYQTVTFDELTSDTTAYDGQKILIRGKYVEGPWGVPQCIPRGTGENPEIIEGYAFYQGGSWALANPDGYGLLGVEVVDDRGTHNHTTPNYERDQRIALRGIARATTFEDPCDRDKRYKTVYIEVNEKDIDITLKPPPPHPPPTGRVQMIFLLVRPDRDSGVPITEVHGRTADWLRSRIVLL